MTEKSHIRKARICINGTTRVIQLYTGSFPLNYFVYPRKSDTLAQYQANGATTTDRRWLAWGEVAHPVEPLSPHVQQGWD
jgi:hypothetical protein